MSGPRVSNWSFADVSPRLLGVASSMVTAFVVIGLFLVGNLGLLEDTYEIDALFVDSGGLRPGNNVVFHGLEVGKVNAVEPDFLEGHVVVTFQLDRGVEIGPMATAEVELATLLGGQYLSLGGSVESPFMSSMDRDKRVIPLGRTRVPVTVNDLFNEVTGRVEGLDTVALGQVFDGLAEVASTNGDAYATLTRNLADVAEAINARGADLVELLANSETVTATLAERDRELGVLLSVAADLMDQLARRRDAIGRLLRDGASSTSGLVELLEDHQEELDQLLSDFHVLAGVVEPRLADLNDALVLAGPGFTGLRRASLSGPWFDAVATGIPLLDLVALIEDLGDPVAAP